MDVRDKIRNFVSTELTHKSKAEAVVDTESLLERGILDSLGLLRVLAFLEQEYQLTVRDEDVIPENFESVNAITALVERYGNRR